MNSESLMLLQAIDDGMDQVFEELRPRRFLAISIPATPPAG
ncbi:hypothetical protein [Prochlorococcus marinus]|nr:hypothetical protein [Prochlorococcus marinus]